MIDHQAGAQCIIEPLDPSRHDRAAFFLRDRARRQLFQEDREQARPDRQCPGFCPYRSGWGGLIGFYATNAHDIHYSELPDKFPRDQPGHGHIPAASISMIGVDLHHQGKGFGGGLLVDCLRRIAGAAEDIAIRVVLLDVLDCGDPALTERRRALYGGYGFAPFPSNDLRMYLPVSDAHRARSRVRLAPSGIVPPRLG